jgi:hypothetical protein
MPQVHPRFELFATLTSRWTADCYRRNIAPLMGQLFGAGQVVGESDRNMDGLGLVEQFGRTIDYGKRIPWRCPCPARKNSNDSLFHLPVHFG